MITLLAWRKKRQTTTISAECKEVREREIGISQRKKKRVKILINRELFHLMKTEKKKKRKKELV